MNVQEVIVLKLRKEEGTDEIMKGNQSFHQRHNLIKMANPLLIILMITDLNQPHMERSGSWYLWLMIT